MSLSIAAAGPQGRHVFITRELTGLILPIRAYGDPILREKAHEVTGNSPELQVLIDNMIETMRGADGAGLAAPQVGQGLRLFVADLTEAWRALPLSLRTEIPPQPMVCINPEIIETSDEQAEFGEGCLSIPGLIEEIRRPWRVKLRYLDREFQECEIEGVSYTASVLQHEYDHLDGILHIDYLTSERRMQLEEKLRDIETGRVRPSYPMQYHISPDSAT